MNMDNNMQKIIVWDFSRLVH